MPETRTVKGFSKVLLPFAEGDFEFRTFDLSDNSPYILTVWKNKENFWELSLGTAKN